MGAWRRDAPGPSQQCERFSQVEGGRERLGDLGLACPGLALEEQRTLQIEGERERSDKSLAGDVTGPGEAGPQLVGWVARRVHGRCGRNVRSVGRGRVALKPVDSDVCIVHISVDGFELRSGATWLFTR